ncbi:MAG: molecular chaperone [Thermoplasmata archaeon]
MTDPQRIQIAEVALQLGAVYGALARAFGPVKNLGGGRALRELHRLQAHRPVGAFSLTSLPDMREDDLEDLEVLTAERLRLFEKGECPPYESSYRGETDPLKDVLMADVAGFYRAFGLIPSGELPDHLVSELEFVGLLCLQEARAVLAGDEGATAILRDALRKFMTDHLGRWVGRFRDEVQKKSRVRLYPLLADVLVELIEAEKVRLGIPPGIVTEARDGEVAS